MSVPRLLVPALVLGCALALPAPAADPPTKKELQTSQDNLKAITLAAIEFADRNNGRMATNMTDINDKDGKNF